MKFQQFVEGVWFDWCDFIGRGNQECTAWRHGHYWVHMTHDEDKQTQKHNTTQKIKKDEQYVPHQKSGAREENAVPVWWRFT